MAEDLQGLQDLLKSMDGLTLLQRKRIIARSLRKAAEPIKERAAALAPNDPDTPGSRISESMSITVSDQTATGAVAKVGPTKHGFPGIMAEVGTVHQPSRPWLSKAFDETIDTAYETLASDLGDAIEKEFSK